MALPRWEIASFSSTVSSADVRSPPLGHEQHVVAEAAVAAGLADDPAGHLAVHHVLGDPAGPDRVGEGDRAGEVRAAPLVGHVGELLEQQQVVRVRRPCADAGPARGQHARHAVQRVDAEPAVVGDRRQARSPRQPACALSSALPSKVGSVSAGSSYGATSSSPSTSTSGTQLDEDPPHLEELLGVARSQEDLGAHPARAARCSRGEVGAALLGQGQQAVEHRPGRTGRPRRCPAPRRRRRRRSSRRSCRSRRGRPPRRAGRGAAHRR